MDTLRKAPGQLQGCRGCRGCVLAQILHSGLHTPPQFTPSLPAPGPGMRSPVDAWGGIAPLLKEGEAQQHTPQQPLPQFQVGGHVEDPPSQEQVWTRTQKASPQGQLFANSSSAVVLGQQQGSPQRPFVQLPVWGLALPQLVPSRTQPRAWVAPAPGQTFHPLPPAPPTWLPKGQRREVLPPTPPHPAPTKSGQPGTSPGSLVPGSKF